MAARRGNSVLRRDASRDDEAASGHGRTDGIVIQGPSERRRSMVGSSLLLMAGAIMLNIVLGQLVQRVLHLPLYLDSVGTILIAALLGPLAGSVTGALTNLIWSVVFSVPQI